MKFISIEWIGKYRQGGPEGALFNRVNPLRAGIIANPGKLNRYKYCGHSALMGRRECEWQEKRYVLSYFGKSLAEARRSYSSYVKEGLSKGRRPELVGGGLIRSLGGWEAIKGMGKRERIKGDERILGDSDFVLQVLEETDETFNRYYEMKMLGYDLKTVEDRVCRIFKIDSEDIYSKSREKKRGQTYA